jgi:hypothetical protein
MNVKRNEPSTASCRCGAVVLEVVGPPIVHAACYCASCQEAGRQIESLPDAPPVLDADGGTDFVLYRKDRVRCVQGGDVMEARRLKLKSPTRRMVATCCNSAMFLDFTKSHWLTLYRARQHGPVRPLEMLVITSEQREGVVLPADAPNYATHSGKFMWTLLAAWVLMRFRTPNMEGGRGSLNLATRILRKSQFSPVAPTGILGDGPLVARISGL